MLVRTVVVATKTLDAIDAAMRKDDGAAFRVWQGRVLPHIGDAYRGEDGGHRGHLGASLLGRDCAREIWYGFRWAHKGKAEPRMMRLWNRGHLEEGRFIALLLMIGCEVYQQDGEGKQFRISFAEGHGGGSGDGQVTNIPDLPGVHLALCEFKTHNEKSFTKLAGKPDDWRLYRAGKGPFTGEGVRAVKFEHYVQMQLYMRQMGLAAGIYMAVNKNADDIYAEVVALDHDLADRFLDRGEQLVWMREPPKRVSESPGFWKCRFCDKKPVCHEGAAPELNCRTCVHAQPGKAKTWHCGRHGALLDNERQRVGCTDYQPLPM